MRPLWSDPGYAPSATLRQVYWYVLRANLRWMLSQGDEKGAGDPSPSEGCGRDTHCDAEKKSPENRTNLPAGTAGLDEPQKDGVPAWFTSHFSLRLGPVHTDDVIGELRPAGIKASGGKVVGESVVEELWDFPTGRDGGPGRGQGGGPKRDPARGSKARFKGPHHPGQ